MRVTAKFDRKLIWYRGNSVRYLVVRVTDPGEGTARAKAALSLSLVVDASGSMAGAPLQFAVDAAQRVVRQLSSEDRLSVVSFDESVTDHIACEPMTDVGRERALKALEGIRVGGSTNLSGGWLRGAEHVARHMESGSGLQNRVIVLSDGHANAGITDPAELAEHARQLSERGLYSSTVGIGDGYHGATLEAIAVQGGGLHHRAARPHEIIEVVTAELEEIRLTAAEHINLVIRHAPDVRIKSLNEFPTSHTAGESSCRLGSLASGASRVAIFSVKFPACEPGTQCAFEVQTTWREPGAMDIFSSEPVTLHATSAEGKDNNAQPYDPALTEEIAKVWQAKIVRQIVQLNREGRYAESLKRLDMDLPLFTKYAEHAADGVELIAELQRLREVVNREWSEGSRKEIEVAMHKRAYSRLDARSQQPAPWSASLPDKQ